MRWVGLGIKRAIHARFGFGRDSRSNMDPKLASSYRSARATATRLPLESPRDRTSRNDRRYASGHSGGLPRRIGRTEKCFRAVIERDALGGEVAGLADEHAAGRAGSLPKLAVMNAATAHVLAWRDSDQFSTSTPHRERD
jgi:hypothetical protein